jgi:pilus assembly protein Flp/PilA
MRMVQAVFDRECVEPLNQNLSGASMSLAVKVFSKFLKDEDGAALIEYTVLLGILLIAVIATIGLVGTWVSKQWLALDKALAP